MSPVQGKSPPVQVKEPYGNFDMVTCRLSSCNPECTKYTCRQYSKEGLAVYRERKKERTMEAHILPLHTPQHPDGLTGQKVKTFFSNSSHVSYQIKGNIAYSTRFFFYTHAIPWVESKGQNIFFLKEVELHIKLKGVEHRTPCKHIFCPCTHRL